MRYSCRAPPTLPSIINVNIVVVSLNPETTAGLYRSIGHLGVSKATVMGHRPARCHYNARQGNDDHLFNGIGQ